MKAKFSAITVALGVIALGTVVAPAARAGCGTYPGSQSAGVVKPASFVLGSSLLAADWNFGQESEVPSVVGLWRVHFISEGNLKTIGVKDGDPIDQGYAAWHSDGTEIMNSGRDPVTGSFCLGVWKQTGRNSFKLNHYAMNWSGVTPQTPTNTLVGPTNIHEEIVVDPGKNNFQGSFYIDNYKLDGTLIVHITGNITGLRLTADSPGFVQ
jgi:hypothetical protein